MGKRESFLYRMYIPLSGCILLLTLFLRFAGLGMNGLSEREAALALQALDLQTLTSGQLLYLLPTSLIFRLFGVSDMSARVFPALAGSLLVLLVLLQANKWGYRRCLLLASAFALDPALLYWSKQADGMICVITAAFLTFILLRRGKNTWSIALALLFCGGERFIPFAAAGILTAGLLFVLAKAFPGFGGLLPDRSAFPAVRKRDALLFGLSLLLFSTGFLSFPAGFGALGSGFTRGFIRSGMQVGFAAFLICPVIYLGLPLMTALLSNRNSVPLLISTLFALFALCFRQGVGVFPWLSVLLWYIGIDFFEVWVGVWETEKSFPFLLSACLLPAAVFFLKFRAAELVNSNDLMSPLILRFGNQIRSFNIPQGVAYLLILFVAVCIFVLIVKILETYTGRDAVRAGLWAGASVLCLFGLISASRQAGGFSPADDSPVTAEHALQLSPLGGNRAYFIDRPLTDILTEVSRKENGSETNGTGVIGAADHPLLRWYLRDFTGIRPASDQLNDAGEPAFMIDTADASHIGSGYSGMLYEWLRTVDWKALGPADWVRQVLYGQAPSNVQRISVWQRNDLILDSAPAQYIESE